jgi:hypothetical protein
LNLSSETIVHFFLGFIGVAWLVVQLLTNGKISEVKILIERQTGAIETHVASDEVTHRALEHRLDMLEKG